MEQRISAGENPCAVPSPLCAMRYAPCAVRSSRYALRSCAMLFALFALLFASFGCGYHLRPTGEPIGLSIESLAVPLMTSTSSEPGFEAVFTRIVRDEFISHARMPLVSDEEAEFTLLGRIHTIWTDPQSYNSLEQIIDGNSVFYDETNRRRLRLRLEVSLVEKSTGKVVWREEAMETRASFEVTADPLVNQHNKQIALERIARRLAQRIYLRTMERF
jgi:hypothetical protein